MNVIYILAKTKHKTALYTVKRGELVNVSAQIASDLGLAVDLDTNTVKAPHLELEMRLKSRFKTRQL